MLTKTGIQGGGFLLRDRGFTLLEVVVAVAVSTVLLSGIMAMIHKTISFKGTVTTITNLKKIEMAFETLYRDNIRYVEDNCYGWTGAGCTALSLVPALDTSDATNATLFIDTYSTGAIKAFEEAGCVLTVTAVPRYRMTCTDGYGSSVVFTGISNEHSRNSQYMNGYSRTPYTVTMTSGGNSQIATTWSSGYLDSEYMTRSQEKILTITRAMKSYHLSRTVYEAIKNPCTTGAGGIESADDIIIPWIWQVMGSSPSLTCSGVSAGNCGCTVFTSAVWQNNAAYNTVNTAALCGVLFGNLGLSLSYRVDGFGNPMRVGLLTTPGGVTFASTPPAPAPSYEWAGFPPPYGGHVGVVNAGVWVYSERVIYAQ